MFIATEVSCIDFDTFYEEYLDFQAEYMTKIMELEAAKQKIEELEAAKLKIEDLEA
jgi:hypothetical protein